MRFDYYAATIPAAVTHCHSEILKEFPGALLNDKPVKPYTHGVRHLEHGFRVYHGGINPHPFFVASGEESQRAAEFVRRVYPSHRVARADVAADYIEPGGFDRVVRILDPIARAAGVSVTFIGDPSPTQTAGRTYYYGSASSDVRICVYEKGLHQRSLGFQNVPADWFRVELRVRPRKERKSITAGLKADEMWGLSRWSLKAAEHVLGVSAPYEPDVSMRESTTEKAVAHMIHQYRRALQAFVAQYGRETLDQRITEALADD